MFNVDVVVVLLLLFCLPLFNDVGVCAAVVVQ